VSGECERDVSCEYVCVSVLCMSQMRDMYAYSRSHHTFIPIRLHTQTLVLVRILTGFVRTHTLPHTHVHTPANFILTHTHTHIHAHAHAHAHAHRHIYTQVPILTEVLKTDVRLCVRCAALRCMKRLTAGTVGAVDDDVLNVSGGEWVSEWVSG